MIIYPGTFNPFHQGHMAVVNAVRQHFMNQLIYVIPTGQPPHRADILATPADRLAMARLALNTTSGVMVSDCECVRPGPHYTVETILALNIEQTHMTLVLGRDALISLPSWHKAQWLAENVSLLAINRGEEADLPKLPEFFNDKPQAQWVSTPVHPASATVIRQCIQNRHPVPDGWLHPAVQAYIEHHGLYR